tara:strand:- start:14652 stop:16751 length:2100 start_codon:yes stop_codon:yes gene_type:complete
MTEQNIKHIPIPKTKKKIKKLSIHNHTRNDPYFWMRLSDKQKEDKEPDQQTKDVLNYIKKENTYKNKSLAHTKQFQKSLFDEITGRIKKDDNSVPYFDNGYWYYIRFKKGQEYPLYCRKKETLKAKEEIFIDVNKLAKGHSYFKLSGVEISPDNNYCAFGIDTVGRRIYTLHFKNLKTNQISIDKVKQTSGGYAWANDNKTIFYTKKNIKTLLPEKVYRHVLGTTKTKDKLIYTEKDKRYYTGVYKSKSQDLIIIYNSATLSDDYRFLNANTPNATFRQFIKREEAHEYSIYHYKKTFYILTNWKAKNFRLMQTSIDKTDKKYWQEIVKHRHDVFIGDIDIFTNHIVITERENALQQLRIINLQNKNEHYIDLNEPVYSVGTTTNINFDTPKLRYVFSSLKTPLSTIEYDMNTKKKTILKQEVVLGGHEPDNYKTERCFATAKDGAKIPISIIYNKNFKKNKKGNVLLYGYGSYGVNVTPGFSSVKLSLLDRGFAFAIAHIRGSKTKGKEWYEEGKLLKKMNTFTDFITVSEYLIKNNYTNPNNLFAMGGSAGGLLMGAISNMRPDLYKGIISAVPFVDVLSTMLDESIPLTIGEFDEWGNPKNKTYYDYILNYSPYDQIKKQHFPNMLITSGYHDSQVQYWEPLKYVAKLRDHWLGNNKVYLHMEMKAGHGGKSGRFRRFKEIALEYAFILDLVNIKK